ncbi:hypothetical protein [Streptomyces celluloflavus]|uniref:hypothetical protein n=1 Tax=Streptomyces celluloflavus TaxID=58344 RepID=UPI0036800CAE
MANVAAADAARRAPFGLLRQQGARSRVRHELPGPRRVAVVGGCPGTGRTTTALGLGDALAVHRSDKVLALEAAPLARDLGFRAGGPGPYNAGHVMAAYEHYGRYGAPRPPAWDRPSGLHVLSADDRADSRYVMGADAYRWMSELLGRHYAITLTDTPADMGLDVMAGVLPAAHSLIITARATVPSASSAVDLWRNLATAGYRLLVRESVLVVHLVAPGTAGALSFAEIRDAFAPKVRDIVPVPWDAHLAEGGPLLFDRLAEPTRAALLTLAATTVGGLQPSSSR